jgi:hypothetical protein
MWFLFAILVTPIDACASGAKLPEISVSCTVPKNTLTGFPKLSHIDNFW